MFSNTAKTFYLKKIYRELGGLKKLMCQLGNSHGPLKTPKGAPIMHLIYRWSACHHTCCLCGNLWVRSVQCERNNKFGTTPPSGPP